MICIDVQVSSLTWLQIPLGSQATTAGGLYKGTRLQLMHLW